MTTDAGLGSPDVLSKERQIPGSAPEAPTYSVTTAPFPSGVSHSTAMVVSVLSTSVTCPGCAGLRAFIDAVCSVPKSGGPAGQKKYRGVERHKIDEEPQRPS